MTHRDELCRKKAGSALEQGARRGEQGRDKDVPAIEVPRQKHMMVPCERESKVSSGRRREEAREREGTHDEPAPDDARRATEAEGRVERGHDGRGDTVGGRGGSAWCGAGGGGGEGAASGSGPAVALAPTRPGPRRCRRGADVPHDRECERDGLQGGRSMVSSTSPSGSEGESDNDGH